MNRETVDARVAELADWAHDVVRLRGQWDSAERFAELARRPMVRDLRLCADPRPCERCKALTRWARPGQRSRGCCQNHAVTSPVDVADAVRALTRVFPGVEVDEGRALMAPGEYATATVRREFRGRWVWSGEYVWAVWYGPPDDAGPCVDCGGIIRRFGPDGWPRCSVCENGVIAT